MTVQELIIQDLERCNAQLRGAVFAADSAIRKLTTGRHAELPIQLFLRQTLEEARVGVQSQAVA